MEAARLAGIAFRSVYYFEAEEVRASWRVRAALVAAYTRVERLGKDAAIQRAEGQRRESQLLAPVTTRALPAPTGVTS